MSLRRRVGLTRAAVVASVVIVGCVVRGAVVTAEHPAPPRAINTPVKAHLADGTTIVFLRGAVVSADSLRGEGWRYDLRLQPVAPVTAVSIDSVVAFESHTTRDKPFESLVLTGVVLAGVVFGAAAFAVALFGSCPTFYADSAGIPVLQAEGFSYSVAPLLEARDTDRLTAQVSPDGSLRLDVRNEALETHHINALELIDIVHQRGETVYPDERGGVLALRGIRPAARAYDRAHRDVARVLAAADGNAYVSAPRVVAAASSADYFDTVEVSIPRHASADTAALVLRLRNSLLTTVLFYDRMLRSQGAGAVDWLGRDLSQIGTAVELGRWARDRLGLRVSVWIDSAWREVARIADPGPIAWHDVAIGLPAPRGDSLRVRLTFLIDAWRIDRLAMSESVRRPDVRIVPLAAVESPGDTAFESRALDVLRAADHRYVETRPGQRFWARFDPGVIPASADRTLLLASHGYYTEWIRTAWITEVSDPRPFVPSDAEIGATFDQWRRTRHDLEARFFSSRIPVR